MCIVDRIQTHLQIILPDNYFGLILPRSGWSTKGLQVKIGLVDACYMGQIIIMATQTKLDKWHVTKGDRLAQILIMENRLPKLPKIVLTQAFQSEEEDTQQLESLEEMEDQKEKEDSQKEEEEEDKGEADEGTEEEEGGGAREKWTQERRKARGERRRGGGGEGGGPPAPPSRTTRTKTGGFFSFRSLASIKGCCKTGNE